MLKRAEGGDEVPYGTVKRFNVAKGFGAISPSDGSSEIFVHLSGFSDPALPPVIVAGDIVAYSLRYGGRGREAVSVRRRGHAGVQLCCCGRSRTGWLR